MPLVLVARRGRSANLCAEAERGGIALTEKAEGHKDWPAAHEAIMARMKKRNLTLAELARLAGCAENTIRYMPARGERGTELPLVAVAAVLGWPWPFDHLRNILHGEPHKNEQAPEEAPDQVSEEPPESAESIAEADSQELLLANIASMKEDIVELRGVVDVMHEAVTRMAEDRGNGSDGPA
jgi:lambda repressor-like predicted transcriptional regulator